MPRFHNREAILADWLAGMTGKELAAKYGCSKTAGSSLAWKRGLKRSAKVKKLERAKNSARAKSHISKNPAKTKHNHEKVAEHIKEHGITAAAVKFGYSREQVRSIAKRLKVKLPSKLNRAAILQDYAAGVPLSTIVEKHGCDRSYPATMAKRAGIKRRWARTK